MGRPQRYIPENRDGVLVEVTVRTIGARALRFHGKDPDVKKDFMEGFRTFLAQYAEASGAYRGGNPEALNWFPPDCYRPALRFLGIAAPPRPPSPPTRRITVLES